MFPPQIKCLTVMNYAADVEPQESDTAVPGITTPAATPVPAEVLPVDLGERKGSIDLLRGVALCGILLMNIYAFSMPFQAYDNPPIYGGTGALDIGTWLFNHLFSELKFMTIFSALFGAGMVLMAERAAALGRRFAGVWYRRQALLMLIGMMHGYLLWFGDILFHYGLCGMLLYPLRRASAKNLITLGLVTLSVAPLLNTGIGLAMGYVRNQGKAVEARAEAGLELDAEEQLTLERWREMAIFLQPDAAEIERSVEVHHGGWWGIAKERSELVLTMQTFITLTLILWRATGVMLIGMGLMKLGILSAERSRLFYGRAMLWGYGLGLPLVAIGAWDHWSHNFDSLRLMAVGAHFNYYGSLGVALGHVGLVMLFWQSGVAIWLRRRLQAVGRMAFTNYLMQTVVCTTLFYGYGFDLFGRFSRFEQMGFVLGVWLLQLLWSPWWLARFRFGPAEWAWRSLTYRQRQPMLRERAG